jgi:ABC-type multidrug transport system fused ATPase/permease subunit
LGKITNLLANDLGVIEQRMAILIGSSIFPVMIIGITSILCARLGWPGLIGIIMVVLLVPFTNKISKTNGETIQEINRFKDRRVQLTTEVI